jgi:hypothetical protein
MKKEKEKRGRRKGSRVFKVYIEPMSHDSFPKQKTALQLNEK